MLRVFLLMIVLALAACSSVPTRQSSAGMPTGAAPRAWKPPADLPVFVDHSVGEEEVSIQAMSLVGVPYRWGGNTPDAGFDCSGLVRYVVARAARVDLPRTTSEMSLVGNSIEPGEVAPGDLIFFNTTGRPHSHVGIYVGGYRFVNAPSTGGTVRIDYISNPYWAKRFDGIRRVAATNKSATPFDAPRLVTSVAPEPSATRPVTRVTENMPERAVPVTAVAAYEVPAQQDGRLVPAANTVSPAATVPTMAAAPVSRVAPVTALAPVAADAQPDPYEPPIPHLAPAAQASISPSGQANTAAADAFEPPPPSRVAAESQAAAEHATAIDPIAAFAGSNNGASRTESAREEVPVRAATGETRPEGRATHLSDSPAATDDPIARFANGG
jgi:NlpC/P60 family